MQLNSTAGSFRTTHWTVVLAASGANDEISREAFANLYLQYWPPLYAYARRRGLAPAEAEDVTQDFFVHLVSKQALAGLQRAGGKFRSFLLKSLDNFLANERDRALSRKRGAGQRPLSLNIDAGETHYALDVPDNDTPESLFDRHWAYTLLENVTRQLRGEYAEPGKRKLFDRVRDCLQGDRSGPAYATVAEQCGMSLGAVKVAVHRMRQRYGELLRQAIAQTVSQPDEVGDELRHLLDIVGR